MAGPADVLQRAERAADQADARVRDADRIGRRTVNVARGLAAVLLAAVLGLYAAAADARSSFLRWLARPRADGSDCGRSPL